MATKKKAEEPKKKIAYVRVKLDFILGFEGDASKVSVLYGLGPGDSMLRFINAGLQAIKMRPDPQVIGAQHVSLTVHPARYGDKLPPKKDG